MSEPPKDKDVRPAAIVVGAGVAGMTVAHELAERGYDVHVIEREVDVEAPDLPDTGGAARTQWWHPPSATAVPKAKDATTPWLPRTRTIELYSEGLTGIDLDEEDVENFDTILSSCRTVRILEDAVETYEALDAPFLKWWNGDATPPEKFYDSDFRFSIDVWHTSTDLAQKWVQKIQNRGEESRIFVRLRNEVSASSPIAGQLIRALERVLCDNERFNRYGYRSIELEGRSPTRARVILKIDTRAPRKDPVVGFVRPVGPRTALPGEHGYRFFPSFYRNVFDSMKKVPILRSARRDAKTPVDEVSDVYRSVYDNLNSVQRHSLAYPDGRGPITLDRRRVRSLHGAMKMWRVFQQKLGFSLRDILLYQVSLLRFLTSGEARRKDAERVSWNAYVQAERFSPAFQEALSSWSLALGGLRGDEADARTFGAIALQFVLDQLEDREVVDGTLNGPTSQAWFQPWRRMLARQNVLPGDVTFHNDQVEKLVLVGEEVQVICRHGLTYRPDGKAAPPPPTPRPRPLLPRRATLIIATQPHEAYRLLRGLKHRDSKFDPGGNLKGLFTLLGAPGTCGSFLPSHLSEGEPPGPLRHFVGIQFYQGATSAIAEGHIYLPKSAWGLTAIGQSQFRTSREDGRRGVISVDVGAAYRCEDDDGNFVSAATKEPAPSGPGEKTPYWDSTRANGVATVWESLRAAASGGPVDLPKDPPVHTIDRGIVWGKRNGSDLAIPEFWFHANTTPDCMWETAWLWDQPGTIEADDLPLYDNNPYLITTAGRFAERPGQIDRARKMRGYDPIDKNVFLAGAYTQTFTRIVTMESACESGRHVVNGILRKLKEKGEDAPERCRVHDPEDLEPEDLSYWKELDDRLHAAGLPHLLDILRVDSWLEELLPAEEEDDDDTGDTATLVDRFDRLVDVFEPDGDGVKRLIQWAGAKSFGLLGLALRILGR